MLNIMLMSLSNVPLLTVTYRIRIWLFYYLRIYLIFRLNWQVLIALLGIVTVTCNNWFYPLGNRQLVEYLLPLLYIGCSNWQRTLEEKSTCRYVRCESDSEVCTGRLGHVTVTIPGKWEQNESQLVKTAVWAPWASMPLYRARHGMSMKQVCHSTQNII